MSNGVTEQARQVQRPAASNQEAWDRYVDSRIQLYLSRRAEVQTDVLPTALHDALGQVLAEERRQWRRERALIESEAKAVISNLRATISELAGEIRQKAMDIKSGVPGATGPAGPPGAAGKLADGEEVRGRQGLLRGRLCGLRRRPVPSDARHRQWRYASRLDLSGARWS